MNKFNLSQWESNKVAEYVGRYVKAMGYTHQKYRDQYRWWDYDTLRESPPEDWSNWVSADPSLVDALRDAADIRWKKLREVRQIYGISSQEAAKIVKTYVGYHPSYGGYICQLGPYISAGGGHGSGFIIEEAIDKFGYYIKRKRRSTPEQVMKSVLKNISGYQNRFGIDFDASDFGYVIKENPSEFDSVRSRQPNKTVREYVSTLDPQSPEAQSFFDRAPMVGEGSHFTLNNRGYDKLLRGLMGTWYQEAIRERMAQQNLTEEQVVNSILTNPETLRSIYTSTYQKWQEARNSGEAAAAGMTAPPKFMDASLKPKSGQVIMSTIPSNKSMVSELEFRQEILQLLSEGVDSPEAIAGRLNADPAREIKNRALQGRGRESVVISPDEVQMRINRINALRESDDGQKDYQQLLGENSQMIDELAVGRGFDDLRTAFEMAAMYFSSMPVEPKSGAKLGSANSIIFNPPENFENFTSQDLARFRRERTGKTEEELATEEDVARDIGEIPLTKEEEPAPERVPEAELPDEKNDLEELLGRTLKNLIKIAAELDEEGKDDAAEEIHKVIRKYQERIL